MESSKNKKREIVLYLLILFILIIFSVCNEKYWRLGKLNETKEQNNITYLESQNIIYDVPYEEIWMD